jgi:hypothetical protein
MHWIYLAQDRDQWGASCEHNNEPFGSIKVGNLTAECNINFLRTLLHGVSGT